MQKRKQPSSSSDGPQTGERPAKRTKVEPLFDRRNRTLTAQDAAAVGAGAHRPTHGAVPRQEPTHSTVTSGSASRSAGQPPRDAPSRSSTCSGLPQQPVMVSVHTQTDRYPTANPFDLLAPICTDDSFSSI